MADVFKEGSTGAGGSGAIVVNLQGKKPAYISSLDADDPGLIALADIIFWADQFSEHSQLEQADTALNIQLIAAQLLMRSS